MVFFFFSSRRRHTRCALVTGVQTCALPISLRGRGGRDRLSPFKQDRRRRTPALLREIRAAISLPPCGSSPWAKTACGLGERERLEPRCRASGRRSEEHTSELKSLMRSSYAVFSLKKKKDT